MILFISAKEFGKAQSEYVKQGNKFGPLDTNYTILEGNNAKALEMGDGYTDSQYKAKGLTVKGIKDINPTEYVIIEEGQTEDGDDYIIIAPIATETTETTSNLEVAKTILETAHEIDTDELLQYIQEYAKPLTDADDQANFCQWLEGNKGVFESFNLAYIAEDTDRLNNVIKFGDRCRIFKWCYLSPFIV